MRVAVVHPNTDLYGSDRMLLRTVQALHAAGLEVELFVPARGAFTKELDELHLAWQLVAFPVLRRTLLSPKGLTQLGRDLLLSLPAVVRATRRADCVYVNTVNCGVWLAAARAVGVPALCHVRENEPGMGRLQRTLLLLPLLMATRVLANSRSTKDWVVGSFGRLGTRTQVVYNGLDLPVAASVLQLRAGDPVRLLVVGRLSWRKGQDVAVRALARLREAGVDASLTLAGDHYPGYEAYVDDLHRIADGLGVSDHVHFVGFQHDLAPVWAAADVALVPSLLEPFGNVAVEAMAAGVPVVVSRVQGLTEIVEAGRTGWFVLPGDDQALAQAVQALLGNPGLTRAVAATAAEDVRRRFSLARYNTDIVTAILAAASVGPRRLSRRGRCSTVGPLHPSNTT